MKKYFFLACVMLFSTITLLAQTSGIFGNIEYKQITMIDTVINSTDETTGVLYFDSEKKKSLYQWDRKNNNYKREFQKDKDGTLKVVRPNGNLGTDSLGRVVYKQYNNSVFKVRDKSGKWYIISDTVAIKWTIENETRIIGNMTVQKAFGDFRGRRYIAWFNPNIPIPDGPWKLSGLPGLIIEAYDEKKHIRFEFIALTMPAPFKDVVNEPIDGNLINFKSFQEIRLKSLDEFMKNAESRLKQRGLKTEGGVMRTNIIERSY
jgi:GLPGLI family protein